MLPDGDVHLVYAHFWNKSWKCESYMYLDFDNKSFSATLSQLWKVLISIAAAMVYSIIKSS